MPGPWPSGPDLLGDDSTAPGSGPARVRARGPGGVSSRDPMMRRIGTSYTPAVWALRPERGLAEMSPRIFHSHVPPGGRLSPMEAHRANLLRPWQLRPADGVSASWRFRGLGSGWRPGRPAGRAGPAARSLVLTFDDGYENFADHALPVLPVMVSPPPSTPSAAGLGAGLQWYGEDPLAPLPRLDGCGRLRAIHAAGMTVGSHTPTTPASRG